MIDAGTGERIEFRFLPASVDLRRTEPATHPLGWAYPVSTGADYVERMKQIEGPTITLKIEAETCLMTTVVCQP